MKINKQPQNINNNLGVSKSAQRSPAQAPPKKNIIKQPVDLTLNNDTLNQLPGAKEKPTILDLMDNDFDGPAIQTTLATGEEGGDGGPKFPKPGKKDPFQMQTTLAMGEEGGDDGPKFPKPGKKDPFQMQTTLAVGEEGGDMSNNWEQKIKGLMGNIED